ncbi:MAG: hypothetical protein ACFFBP_16150 [Promethearchaeota archaeon]
MPSNQHICLECGKEFNNKFDLAICSSCLERERENYEKGIRSKYTTVFLYLSRKNY